ncbi:MAG: NAD(+)/NADH kinase [Nitrososphaerota archaeon]
MEFAVVHTLKKVNSGMMAEAICNLIKQHGYPFKCFSLEDVLNGSQISCDILIVLGGDGTILTSIHNLEDPETPIFGISYGRGGYLAEGKPENAIECVKKILSGEYHLERHIRLEVKLNDVKIGDAINEIYISNVLPGKVIEYTIIIDNNKLATNVGDGIIISTPLGSTAYNLSNLGPAVDDLIDCIIINPVLSLSYVPPIIIPASRKISLLIPKIDSSLLIDGYIRRTSPDSFVEIAKSQVYTVFVRVTGESWFVQRLRKRLHW